MTVTNVKILILAEGFGEEWTTFFQEGARSSLPVANLLRKKKEREKTAREKSIEFGGEEKTQS